MPDIEGPRRVSGTLRLTQPDVIDNKLGPSVLPLERQVTKFSCFKPIVACIRVSHAGQGTMSSQSRREYEYTSLDKGNGEQTRQQVSTMKISMRAYGPFRSKLRIYQLSQPCRIRGAR
jgi:hypothetical protein